MDIQIEGLSKSFGNKPVLRNFSATIRAGKVTAIMGPSGCGKTTLLHLLLGILRPDGGTISGIPVYKSAVFQEERLCEPFSAIANVRMVCTKEVSAATIEEHLLRLGLKDSLRKPVAELSGGMKRRVAIVRAMLAKSDIVFLDEPFKGLDAELKQQVMRYVQDSTKGKTVVMITHDGEEVRQMEADLISMD